MGLYPVRSSGLTETEGLKMALWTAQLSGNWSPILPGTKCLTLSNIGGGQLWFSTYVCLAVVTGVHVPSHNPLPLATQASRWWDLQPKNMLFTAALPASSNGFIWKGVHSTEDEEQKKPWLPSRLEFRKTIYIGRLHEQRSSFKGLWSLFSTLL